MAAFTLNEAEAECEMFRAEDVVSLSTFLLLENMLPLSFLT